MVASAIFWRFQGIASPGWPRASARSCDGLKEALTENERYAVADHVVSQLREHGDPCKLSEEARRKRGPTTA
jgi:hypothetical protein